MTRDDTPELAPPPANQPAQQQQPLPAYPPYPYYPSFPPSDSPYPYSSYPYLSPPPAGPSQPSPGGASAAPVPPQPAPYTPYPYGYAPPVPYAYAYPPTAAYVPGMPVPTHAQPTHSIDTWWIVPLVLGGVFMFVGCAGLLFATIARAPAGVFSDSGAVIHTVNLFCKAEEGADYPAAYRFLSSDLQARESESQFIQESQGRESRFGRVRTCAAAHRPDFFGDSRAPVQVRLTLDDTECVGTVDLVGEGGAWKIDAIDFALTLLSLGDRNERTT